MRDCWTILGIPPTDDLDAIKRAYRALMKKFHPDTVFTQENKRRYTLLCAEINAAYKEATDRAKGAGRDYSDEFTGQPGEERSWDRPNVTGEASESHGNLFRVAARSGIAVSALLAFFILLELSLFVSSPVASIPEAMKIALSIGLVLFVTVVIYGIIFAGVVDFFLAVILSRVVLARLGLAKYEDKAVWLFLLTANIGIFLFTDLITSPPSSDSSIRILDGLLRLIAAATVPIILAAGRIRRLLRRGNNEVSDLIDSQTVS